MTTFSINRTVGYGTRDSAVGERMRENLNTVTHGDISQLERIRSSLDEPKADAVSSGMGSDGISGGAAVQAVIDAAREAVAHHSRGYRTDVPWDANIQILLLDKLEDALAAMDYPAPEGNAP